MNAQYAATMAETRVRSQPTMHPEDCLDT
jgi:hypothetical protein